jgi:hypothetical protein
VITTTRGCSDCPSPHVLGEYALGLLEGGRRAATIRHVLVCLPCSAELSVLRSFLWAEPDEGPTAAAKAPGAAGRIVSAALAAIGAIASSVPRPAPAIGPRLS